MDTSTPEPPRGQSPQFPLPTLFQQMSSTSLWPVLCLPLFYGKFIYDFWLKCDSYSSIETSFWTCHCGPVGVSSQEAGRVLLHQKLDLRGNPSRILWAPYWLWTGATLNILIWRYVSDSLAPLSNWPLELYQRYDQDCFSVSLQPPSERALKFIYGDWYLSVKDTWVKPAMTVC